MSLAGKLQLKPGMTLAVVDAPEGIVAGLSAEHEPDELGSADAVLLFAENREQLLAQADPLVQAARRDALAWVAYPKAGQLGTDLNRDSLAAALSEREIRAVRQIAIDDVWSALRFRPG